MDTETIQSDRCRQDAWKSRVKDIYKLLIKLQCNWVVTVIFIELKYRQSSGLLRIINHQPSN